MSGVGTGFMGPHGPVRDSAAVAGLRSEFASERKKRKFLRDPCVMGGVGPARVGQASRCDFEYRLAARVRAAGTNATRTMPSPDRRASGSARAGRTGRCAY